ncbi:hypothetical protein [Nocardia yamanashiensis]|uniref:hypothetical protein n=1 Tax=Nocardia yamanashiensis TaxID=209247 RepID=UPI00082F28CE|nr:hypothetical protein [Nocardia yamanashiensis]
MDESLTALGAQRRIHELMTDTLRGLPPGIELSKTPANPNLATFDPYPVTPPCWEGNVQTEGPHYARVTYWVAGVPAGATREYFDRIAAVWRERGWQPTDSDQWSYTVKTPDGYGLRINDAGKGDGSLGMLGMSPCFPEAALEPIDPDPPRITAG